MIGWEETVKGYLTSQFYCRDKDRFGETFGIEISQYSAMRLLLFFSFILVSKGFKW